MNDTNEILSLPHAPIAEKSLLSLGMQNLSLIPRSKADGIDEECFYLPTHLTLWNALSAYRLKFPDHEECDISILIQDANLEGNLNAMGGPGLVAEIWGYAMGGSKNLSHWAEILREMKARRIAKKISVEINEAEDSEEAIALARKATDALAGALTGKTRSKNANAASRAFIEKFVKDSNAGDIPGISTGIPEIDNASGGMREGELWIVGAKSSRGKSVLMLQVTANAVANGKRVAFFSCEMMCNEIVTRLVSYSGRIPMEAITQPRKDPKSGTLKKIQSAAKMLATYPLTIDDSGGQSLDSIASEAERLRDQNGGIDMIVVDYIQIVKGIRGRNDSRETEVANISGGLKQLAKSMGCPVMTGTQLNKANSPRESEAIIQDADVLLFIHHDEDAHGKKDDSAIHVGKMRNGKRGTVLPLVLDGSFQRFVTKF
mgnify:CR=1 FL=1